MRWQRSFLSLALFLAACTGNLDVGDSIPTTGTATGTEVLTPQQVTAARANCTAPHGPASPAPTTCAEAAAAILGAWLTCSVQADPGDTTTITSQDAQPVLFKADGTWQYLGLDAQGGLVALDSLGNQGTWSVCNVESGDGADAGPEAGAYDGTTTLYMYYDDNGGNGGAFGIETSPERLEWTPDYRTMWYVALPAPQ